MSPRTPGSSVARRIPPPSRAPSPLALLALFVIGGALALGGLCSFADAIDPCANVPNPFDLVDPLPPLATCPPGGGASTGG